MTAEHDALYQDAELASFYDVENGWGADTRACLALAEGARSVLDLGCGTGLLAAALTGPREVVGIDPAGAMLDIARRRPGGEAVGWVEADARTVRLGRRFDLIVMTGHAFQVFLTDADQAAVAATIAAHLAPGGRFVFDSRNPAVGKWRDWTPEASLRRIAHPRHGTVEAWNDVAHDAAAGIVTYGTHYRVLATGGILSARSRIRFRPREGIAAALAGAGLAVDAWWGDWAGSPWTVGSPEIIPLGRLA